MIKFFSKVFTCGGSCGGTKNCFDAVLQKEKPVHFPCHLSEDVLHQLLWKTVKEQLYINVDDNSISVILSYLKQNWSWRTLYPDEYEISEDNLTVVNHSQGSSSWSRWAFTDAFSQTGSSKITIRINHKRPDHGWLGIGVIRKSFVEQATATDGGFKVYSKHALFIDPSWNANEPHFNLKYLNVSKQNSMKSGDTVTLVVDNISERILFYLNKERKHFAEGDWSVINYEPVCTYVILTSKNDKLSIVTDDDDDEVIKKNGLKRLNYL